MDKKQENIRNSILRKIFFESKKWILKFEKNEICYVFQELLLYMLLEENWVEINIKHKKKFFGLKIDLKKGFYK